MKPHVRIGISLCSVLVFTAIAEARTTVKMASLVPDGSVWGKVLKEMGAEWQESTDGELNLRFYSGGVAGDEPDVVRKMRIGQLHAAALTTAGLTTIDKGFEIFEIPMFLESYGELFHALDQLRPVFEKRLADRGYILLNWGQGGWVHFFSKRPIRAVDDLRGQKLFSWSADQTMTDLWRRNRFKPVALAATDILPGLQTGMIEALATTPLAALSLQWFRQTPYMQDLGLAPLIGAMVMTEKTWKRLSPGVQASVRKIARSTEQKLKEQIPLQDAKAVEEMKKRGLEVVVVSPEIEKEWVQMAEIFSQHKRESIEDKELLDRLREVRDGYRSSH